MGRGSKDFIVAKTFAKGLGVSVGKNGSRVSSNSSRLTFFVTGCSDGTGLV